jgi:RNA polymerase sigma factor (TIGR02999 family)
MTTKRLPVRCRAELLGWVSFTGQDHYWTRGVFEPESGFEQYRALFDRERKLSERLKHSQDADQWQAALQRINELGLSVGEPGIPVRDFKIDANGQVEFKFVIDRGVPQAVRELVPVVYDELRRLAAGRVSWKRPGQTLDATVLHEAFRRLSGDPKFADPLLFLRAAAEAMGRILIDQALQKLGGDPHRVPLSEAEHEVTNPDDMKALDEVIERLARIDPVKADLFKLCHFARLSEDQAAAVLGISRDIASKYWMDAHRWLIKAVREKCDEGLT